MVYGEAFLLLFLTFMWIHDFNGQLASFNGKNEIAWGLR